jgi:hypothetical protein
MLQSAQACAPRNAVPMRLGGEKECEPQHIPLGEIPVALISQSAERSKLMDEIANMLGAV